MTAPTEVVTRAPVRYVELPLGAGTAALVTLENGHDHTRPTTLGPQGLANLDAALVEALDRDDVAAVCVTGKPFVFCAGADLKVAAATASRADVLALGRLGHRVFRRLRDARVPTFAFVNGAALGGGLELALHCHYRTISSSVTTVALPECLLGMVPAWGGSQLLPNLVGADAAVQVIIENPLSQNRMLAAPAALRLGLADAVFAPADFLEESLRWAAQVVRGEVAVRRREVDRGEAWTTALRRGRAFVDAKLRGAAPAPYRALELLELARTATFDEGTAAEDEALADLAFTDEMRASLYAFDLVQRRAKRPVGAPGRELARPVTKVGIVGAGLMASQLALLFVQRLKVPVVMSDLDQQRVERGLGWARARLDERLAEGRASLDATNRCKALLSGSVDQAAFADADLVVEAVFEELEVKRQVFRGLEAVVGEQCVFATNTSALLVSAMAAPLRHPGRVVGLHFFNPVAVLPLVEVVRADRTDEATLATAFAVGADLGKSCVLVRDAPGFVVNRLLARLLGEVMRAVDEGTPVDTADRALDPLGLPMSPLMLLELVGPPVALHVAEALHAAYPDRFTVSENLRRLVQAGKPGVYVRDERGRPRVDPELAAVLAAGSQPSTGEQVRDRALRALALEARLMLDEGVVAQVPDLDLCLLLGAGWPFHLGGITPYLDRTGVAEQVTGRRFLPPGVASVPRRVVAAHSRG